MPDKDGWPVRGDTLLGNAEVGRFTGGSRPRGLPQPRDGAGARGWRAPCRLEGCNCRQYGVRWPDGKLNYVSTDAFESVTPLTQIATSARDGASGSYRLLMTKDPL